MSTSEKNYRYSITLPQAQLADLTEEKRKEGQKPMTLSNCTPSRFWRCSTPTGAMLGNRRKTKI